MIKNCRTILPAFVGAIDRWIVGFKKDLCQFLIGSLRWIVGHFYRFGVAGGFGTNLFVSRIFGMPAGVAHARSNDAGRIIENIFLAPKATRSENRRLGYSCSWTFFFHSSIG